MFLFIKKSNVSKIYPLTQILANWPVAVNEGQESFFAANEPPHGARPHAKTISVFDHNRTPDLSERPARKVKLTDRSPENRQHGNKPYFTRVSLPFSTGNTGATGGNILLATD
jgi:hypothetical protein